MDTILAISALLCGIVGILGAIVPVLPGPVLSFVGMICAYLVSSSQMRSQELWLWGVITLIVTILDYILPAYFSKLFGGTKAGIWGATIGVLAGALIMGPIGIILGPFVGAVAGEMLQQRQNIEQAIKVGLGSLLSFVVGTGVKLLASGFMMYAIWKELYTLLSTLWA